MTNARLDELRAKFQENPRRYFAPFANELRKSGDTAQAITICRNHLTGQPGHVSGHIVLAQALHEAGQHGEAKEVFTAALELDPENLIALRTMGDMAYSSGEFGAARHWYERLLDADPRNHEIASLLSVISSETLSEASPPRASGTSDPVVTTEPTGEAEWGPPPRLDFGTVAEREEPVVEPIEVVDAGAQEAVASFEMLGGDQGPDEPLVVEGLEGAAHGEPEDESGSTDGAEPSLEIEGTETFLSATYPETLDLPDGAEKAAVADADAAPDEEWTLPEVHEAAPVEEPTESAATDFDVFAMPGHEDQVTTGQEATPGWAQPGLTELSPAEAEAASQFTVDAAPWGMAQPEADSGDDSTVSGTTSLEAAELDVPTSPWTDAGIGSSDDTSQLSSPGAAPGREPSDASDLAAGPEPVAASAQDEEPVSELPGLGWPGQAGEDDETPKATFAENGFDGYADDPIGWQQPPVAAAYSDLEAAPEDWFENPAAGSEPLVEEPATEPPEGLSSGAVADTPEDEMEASTAEEDLDWFATDAPADDTASHADGGSDDLFLAPDLGSMGTPVEQAAEGWSAPDHAQVHGSAMEQEQSAAPEPTAPEPSAPEPVVGAVSGERESGPPAEPVVGFAPGGDEATAAGTTAPAPFVTETLAELYLQQGFREEALAIYRQLSSRDPGNEAVRAKVSALQSAPALAEPAALSAAPSSSQSRSVRSFFGGLAHRMPSAAAAQARLARTATEAGQAPEVVGQPPGQGSADSPFAAAASALANLFAASNPPSADERAAGRLAGALAEQVTGGRPSRAAERELSLDHLFRDVPGGSSAAAAEFPASRGESSGQAARPDDSGRVPDEGEADIRQFTAWLEGLRKK